MIVVKNKSLTTNMNPQEKPTTRRRNPEVENSGQTPRVLSSAREDPFLGTFKRELSEDTQGSCKKYTETSADTLESVPGEIGVLRQRHKPPTVFPEVNGILSHVMEPTHTHHLMHDAAFLEWGRNTDLKNLTQEGTASCDEEATKIGTLVRMDVGEILTSTNERGNIPVVLRERILYEEPDGTWKNGYVSGIWWSPWRGTSIEVPKYRVKYRKYFWPPT